MRLADCLLLPALGLLGACATLTGSDPTLPGNDWLAFAADVESSSAAERAESTLIARTDYAEDPGADSAIRLAILIANSENPSPDLAGAVSLLDFAAADPAVDDDDLAFIGVVRPLWRQLAEQGSALAFEVDRRQALEQQIEALKELEEQLNADD